MNSGFRTLGHWDGVSNWYFEATLWLADAFSVVPSLAESHLARINLKTHFRVEKFVQFLTLDQFRSSYEVVKEWLF